MNELPPVYDYVVTEAVSDQPEKIIVWSKRLGYAGLLPFLLSILILLLGNEAAVAWASQALVSYAAIILTFAGALHWTAAMQGPGRAPSVGLLIISVIPSLLAWLGLLLPLSAGLPLMITAFMLLYVFDRNAWYRLPWFVLLRRNLTLVAVGCLLTGWWLV